jgi:aryl-phospho-beta-D-glucosidase BglC (GH1 family)
VTEDDVEKLYQAGINTMRIPLGFWVSSPTSLQSMLSSAS